MTRTDNIIAITSKLAHTLSYMQLTPSHLIYMSPMKLVKRNLTRWLQVYWLLKAR
jgi:hypothetical protein